MKILVDMNLSPDWCRTLSSNGHPAIHWSEVGKPTASDREIMEWAKVHQHVVFTHDLDFSAILAATQANGPSVIQLRTQDPTPIRLEIIVCRSLSQFKAEISAGAVVVIDESHTRIRILPFGA